MSKVSTIIVHNPATDEILGEVPKLSLKEGKQAIERAKSAKAKWAATPLESRISILKRFQHLLVEQTDEFCELISRENGKTLVESFCTEVLSVIDLTSYFCKRAPKLLRPKDIPLHLIRYRRSYIHHKPRGIVYVISPWNFPFSIPTGEIVMALLAGNVVVHKPASLTPLIALKTQELLRKAGLPEDVYQVIPMAGSTAFKLISEGVNYVNFTGSSNVGHKVAAECGKHLVPCSMELGGKDPAIVCHDADIDHAVGSLVWGAFANAGQVCASVERAYVHESIYDEVLKKVVDKVESLKMGNPLIDGISMGPMTDPGQLQQVIDHVETAKEEGATILVGGEAHDGPGQFYPPTIMVDVNDEMECVREETFGPTLPIMKFTDEQDAIRRANDSKFGLNAYVFTTNKERGRAIAEQLEAGTVMINEVLMTHALPETPWGGVKESGLGRVHSDDGFLDLCTPYHVNYDRMRQPAWSPFWQPYTHTTYRALKHATAALFGQGLGGRFGGLASMLGNGQPPVIETESDSSTEPSKDQASLN